MNAAIESPTSMAESTGIAGVWASGDGWVVAIGCPSSHSTGADSHAVSRSAQTVKKRGKEEAAIPKRYCKDRASV
jgi:hypothetical protein